MNYTPYQYRIGHEVNNYDICYGGYYGSKWGITDLYPKCEDNLRSLLDSANDFRTSWCSKKELLSATVMRIAGKTSVSVSAWMDDLWDSSDLIYDALSDVTGLEECIPDDVIDEIKDIAYEVGCNDSVTMSCEGNFQSYDDLMSAISDLADKACAELNRLYFVLCQIVSEIDL